MIARSTKSSHCFLINIIKERILKYLISVTAERFSRPARSINSLLLQADGHHDYLGRYLGSGRHCLGHGGAD